MKTRFLRVLTLLALSLIFTLWNANPALAEVKLAAIFSDYMVLQRDMAMPVWGTADPGEKVTVTFDGQSQNATADAKGKWKVSLSKHKAGGPFEMTVSGTNTLTVKDVYVGEVWLCSGQSNMDMTVAKEDRNWCGVNNEAEEVAAANYPLIREFKVKLKMADEPQEDVKGQWSVCSPATVGKFSATAYFFARELQKKLNVPVGLVTTSYGASTAQAWTSRKALADQKELSPLLDAYAKACEDYANKDISEQALAKWQADSAKAKEEGKPAPKRPSSPKNPHQDQHNPCVLYNGMVIPLAPYAIRGALWYQGESNEVTADKYFVMMKTMIRDWRQLWGQGDFPFIFVQLANYRKLATEPTRSGKTALVREAQLQTLTEPNTGMAVTIDIGNATNIHPKNKQELGNRLSLAARALVYGESVPYSGPIYDSMTIEGNAIRLRFKHVDGGLVAKDGEKLVGFAIRGENDAADSFVWADAKIDGDSVVISSPTVAKPVVAQYGWADNPPVNLYNKAGLPASPFRTDAAAVK